MEVGPPDRCCILFDVFRRVSGCSGFQVLRLVLGTLKVPLVTVSRVFWELQLMGMSLASGSTTLTYSRNALNRDMSDPFLETLESRIDFSNFSLSPLH